MQWIAGGPRVNAPPCALEHATMGAKRRTTRFGGRAGIQVAAIRARYNQNAMPLDVLEPKCSANALALLDGYA